MKLFITLMLSIFLIGCGDYCVVNPSGSIIKSFIPTSGAYENQPSTCHFNQVNETCYMTCILDSHQCVVVMTAEAQTSCPDMAQRY